MALLKKTLDWRVLGILLLGAAGIGFFLSVGPSQQIGSEQSGESSGAETPELFATDVSFQQLNPDGSLYYQLDAAAIEQFEGRNTTELDQPDIHLTNANGPPWDISAESGVLTQQSLAPGAAADPAVDPGGDVVTLINSVEMIQIHPQNGTVRVNSDKFMLYPQEQFAQTDEDVMIDTEVGRTQAAGMHVDLDSGVITLKSDPQQRIHTIILPEQFQQQNKVTN